MTSTNHKSQITNHDIVITGLGCVTPAGSSVNDFWDSLKRNNSGIKELDKRNGLTGKVKYAGECLAFDGNGIDKLVSMGVSSVREAILDASIDLQNGRIGCIISTSKPNLVKDHHSFPGHYSGISSLIVRELGIHATTLNPVGSCVTGLSSLLIGRNMLINDQADIVICGSVDSSLDPFLLAAYDRMGVVLSNGSGPDGFSPYGRMRKGFFPGEGSGVLVLEKKEHADKRGVFKYGKLSSISVISDAYHLTDIDPSGEGIALLLKTLLAGSNEGTFPDYISLHGTATPTNDLAETRALKKIFKELAYTIPMSGIKPFTGHMIGASSIVEVIACLLSLRDGYIPPTLNLKDPDPACDLDYVPHEGIKREVRTALSLSYGFGSLLGGAIIEK